jgi:uracil-DNA glycosylase
MPFFDQSKLPFKHGAITEWRKLVLESNRMYQVLEDIDRWPYNILPCKQDIFNMFRMLHPHQVRVVIVAQSPYPGYCPATQVPYACGPAFMPAIGCATTPATLKNVVSEVSRDMSKRTNKPPRDMLLSWVEQGVMLLNSSLTLGKGCPKYLEDHSILWEEVMRGVMSKISTEFDPIFVLVGKDAWKFETSVQSRVIKVSHPVARKETSTPWMGSCVFSEISDMMIDRGDLPIRWI